MRNLAIHPELGELEIFPSLPGRFGGEGHSPLLLMEILMEILRKIV